MIPTALDFARTFGKIQDFSIMDQKKVAAKLRELANAIDVPRDQYPQLFLAEAHSTQSAAMHEFSSSMLLLKFEVFHGPKATTSKMKTFESRKIVNFIRKRILW